MLVLRRMTALQPSPPTEPPVWSRGASILAWGLIVIGALLRLGRWCHWRSLWLDEIYLANSIVTRSWHALLFKPLEDWQAAPPGFLVLERLAVKTLGPSERSLRLVSLLFGLASLPLALAVARRTLPPRAAIAAIAFFVFLGPLIYYSNELKPYSCDVAFSLAITLATLWLIQQPNLARTAAAVGVGAVGVFFSYPAALVLCGAALVLLLRRRQIQFPGRIWTVCAVWGLAMLGQYVVFVAPFTHGPAHSHLVDYWIARNAFMPWSPSAALRWIFGCLESIASNPGAMWLDYPDAAVVAMIIGAAIVLCRRGHFPSPSTLGERAGNRMLLLAPLPFALLASAMKQYPFGDRLALFFVPQLLMVLAAGLAALWINFPGKIAALALGGMILLPTADRSLGYLFWPPGREESLPAYRWIARQWRPGDVIYLTPFAKPSFDYYESQSGWPAGFDPTAAPHVQPQFADPAGILDDVKSLSRRRRVWVCVIHAEGGPFDVGVFTLAAFESTGHPRASHLEQGARVYLYDCSAPGNPARIEP